MQAQDAELLISGIFLQANGSLIAQRGGIMRPIEGTKVASIQDILNLPWTRDCIADELLFKMCDDFVRLPTTDWETKKKAIHAMVDCSLGFAGEVTDELCAQILAMDSN